MLKYIRMGEKGFIQAIKKNYLVETKQKYHGKFLGEN